MPSLPPNFQPSKPKAAIGPTLPPGFVVSDDNHNEEEDDDGVAGPAPLPAHLASKFALENEGVLALKDREERQKELDRIERESKLLKREEWMLMPPKELDLQASQSFIFLQKSPYFQFHAEVLWIRLRSKLEGSSKLRSPIRVRQTDKTTQDHCGQRPPTERTQRLADEAIGKRRRAEETTKDDGDDLEVSKRKKRDKLMRQQVEEHNVSPTSLDCWKIEQNLYGMLLFLICIRQPLATSQIQRQRQRKKRRKKQAVVWDHDAMMGVNTKLLSKNQKADMIKDAKGFGGRFGGGSFL
ncbi:hypothetical protein H4Q26_013419 [Puccinia striiformis f. sp. tritici PST-130]|nr:hypothetical protein H4Q26_013419 [Puccinia striiformis f. sp. tritici PST-130]